MLTRLLIQENSHCPAPGQSVLALPELDLVDRGIFAHPRDIKHFIKVLMHDFWISLGFHGQES